MHVLKVHQFEHFARFFGLLIENVVIDVKGQMHFQNFIKVSSHHVNKSV